MLLQRIYGFTAVLFAAVLITYGQSSNQFVSASGGFRIDLPQTFTTSKDISFYDDKLSGEGAFYTWQQPQLNFEVQYFRLISDKKILTPADKNLVFQPFREGFIKEVKKQNLPYSEKPYAFKGSSGFVLQAASSQAKTITRYFIVNKRFYSINATFSLNQDEAQILKILDSFSLLDAKSLIAAKLAEAAPQPLPQEPIAAKQTTDAQDNNLSGKIKSVIEDTQYNPKGNRYRSSEQYYDERGNLTKELSYQESGYPDNITVWGYIDGNRVNNSGSIYYDDDQLPPSERTEIIQRIDETPVSNAEVDTRYSSKFIYKYNENGQLIEKQHFSNNGQIFTRNVYKYKANQREELTYGQDGSQWSQTIAILDKNGNIIERHLMDANGKIGDKEINVHEFDAQGNWIVEKTFEETKIKGKPVRKLLWTSYRTITYYP